MSGKTAKTTRKPRTVEVLNPNTGETFEMIPISEVYPQFVKDYGVGRDHALRFAPVPVSELVYDRMLAEISIAALNSGILPESVNVSPPKIANCGAIKVELVRLKDQVVVANGMSKVMPTHPAHDPHAIHRLRASAVRDLLTTLGYIPYSSSLEDEEDGADLAGAAVETPEPEKPVKQDSSSDEERKRVRRRNLMPTRSQLLTIKQYAEELGVEEELRQPADRDDAREIVNALRKARETGDKAKAGSILKPYFRKDQGKEE